MYNEKRTYTEEEYRLGLLEQSVSDIHQTLNRIDYRLNCIEDNINKRFDVIDFKFDDIRKEAKSDFRWLLSIMSILSATLGGIVAHGFHWF